MPFFQTKKILYIVFPGFHSTGSSSCSSTFNIGFYQLVGDHFKCNLWYLKFFFLGSQDNKFDSVTSIFDSSTDCSLLEIFFSKEQYLIVSLLITHKRVFHLI